MTLEGDLPIPDPSPVPPPPEPAPAPAPAPAPESMRDRLASRGYDTSSFADDEALERALFTQLDESNENRRYVEMGRQVAPHAAEFAEWQKGQADPVEPTKPEDAWEWSAPEHDPRWEALCERDPATNRWRAPDSAPELAAVAQKLNASHEFRANALTSFLDNPQDLVSRASRQQFDDLDKSVDARIKTAVDQALAGERSRAANDAWLKQQEKEIYQHDAEGNLLYDHQGYAALSPQGRALANHGEWLRTQAGVTDPAALRRLSEMMLDSDKAQGRFGNGQPSGTPSPSTSPTPTPGEAGEQRRDRFIDRAATGRTPNRDGTDHGSTPGAPLQNPDNDLDQLIEDELTRTGMVTKAGTVAHEG